MQKTAIYAVALKPDSSPNSFSLDVWEVLTLIPSGTISGVRLDLWSPLPRSRTRVRTRARSIASLPRTPPRVRMRATTSLQRGPRHSRIFCSAGPSGSTGCSLRARSQPSIKARGWTTPTIGLPALCPRRPHRGAERASRPCRPLLQVGRVRQSGEESGLRHLHRPRQTARARGGGLHQPSRRTGRGRVGRPRRKGEATSGVERTNAEGA